MTPAAGVCCIDTCTHAPRPNPRALRENTGMCKCATTQQFIDWMCSSLLWCGPHSETNMKYDVLVLVVVAKHPNKQTNKPASWVCASDQGPANQKNSEPPCHARPPLLCCQLLCSRATKVYNTICCHLAKEARHGTNLGRLGAVRSSTWAFGNNSKQRQALGVDY